MHKMRAIVVSGGNPPSKDLLLKIKREDDFVVGVDRGCNYLYDYDITPDIISGDFDSARKEVIDAFENKGIKSIKFNPEKDYTDTYLGYEIAKENGANEVIFFGATGSRYDHSLGNIGILLKALGENIDAKMVDENNTMFLINKESTFKGEYGSLISFHALSDVVRNVNIVGAKYTLENYDMTLLEPRAVCNEFLDEDITISFDSGIVLVIFPRD